MASGRCHIEQREKGDRTMTPPIRVRRHTDGRVALNAHGLWVVIPGENWFRKDDSRCSGHGWVELLVTELPKPDGNCEIDNAPYWNAGDGMPGFVAYEDGIETENGEIVASDLMCADALKMLAAVNACEKYRTGQETTDG